jgi:hypothetical protein|eukprot:2121971-Prymnesium_polylepis.2
MNIGTVKTTQPFQSRALPIVVGEHASRHATIPVASPRRKARSHLHPLRTAGLCSHRSNGLPTFVPLAPGVDRVVATKQCRPRSSRPFSSRRNSCSPLHRRRQGRYASWEWISCGIAGGSARHSDRANLLICTCRYTSSHTRAWAVLCDGVPCNALPVPAHTRYRSGSVFLCWIGIESALCPVS